MSAAGEGAGGEHDRVHPERGTVLGSPCLEEIRSLGSPRRISGHQPRSPRTSFHQGGDIHTQLGGGGRSSTIELLWVVQTPRRESWVESEGDTERRGHWFHINVQEPPVRARTCCCAHSLLPCRPMGQGLIRHAVGIPLPHRCYHCRETCVLGKKRGLFLLVSSQMVWGCRDPGHSLPRIALPEWESLTPEFGTTHVWRSGQNKELTPFMSLHSMPSLFLTL